MLIQSRDQFEKALTVLLDADLVAIDTETYGLLWDQRKLVGLSTYCKVKGKEQYEVAFYFPFRHNHDKTLFGAIDNVPFEWFNELRSALERPDITWIFHHAKFDCQVLRQDEIEIKGPYYDTLIMAHMVNENEFSYRLKTLGKKYIDKKADEQEKRLKDIVKQLGGWEKVPPDVMALYACQDAKLTYKLFEFYRPQLEEQELIDLWPREETFSRALSIMEERGIGLNKQNAKQLAYETQCRISDVLDELGFDPGKPSQLARKLFVIPPKGLGFQPGVLSKRPLSPPIRLADGSYIKHIPVMDEDALKRYTHPVVDLVLEYRGLVKAKSTWFEGFLDSCASDGRIHPTYKQHGTVTTRLSCEKPNMQQLPKINKERRKQVNALLLPMEGYELWEFDYSQIEYRLAGCYSKEPSIIEAYHSGGDFHQLTADKLGIPRDRSGGKINGKDTNFMILYGAGIRKVSAKLEIDTTEAAELLQDFWTAYPRLQEFAQQAQRAAQARGWVRLWTGRRRHFQFSSEYHKAFNSVIQGGAAEIVKTTMVQIHEKYPNLKMISQVHDALWFELDKSKNIEEQKELIISVMEWPGRQFPVPFPVDSTLLVG